MDTLWLNIQVLLPVEDLILTMLNGMVHSLIVQVGEFENRCSAATKIMLVKISRNSATIVTLKGSCVHMVEITQHFYVDLLTL